MTPIVENKVKQTMTDLLTLSVGESWASTIAEDILIEVCNEIDCSIGEDASVNEITTKCVQSHMGEVLDRRLF